MSSASTTLPPIFLVLAGPAGSGKTTLCERMVAMDASFARVITTTTRAPRTGEVAGVHYHFLTPAVFDERVAAGEFLEWAWVHRSGHRYGTLKSSVLPPLQNGQSLIINLDVQGVQSLRQAAAHDPQLARSLGTVFIDVPMEELRRRLFSRGEQADEIERRMLTAQTEQAELPRFEFVITSQSREADFAALQAIAANLRARVG